MTHRTMSLLLVAAVVAVLAPLPAVGQGQAEIWEPPRLGDGRRICRASGTSGPSRRSNGPPSSATERR